MFHPTLAPAEIVKKIELWQRTPFLHPLTCANDSNHPKLQPLEEVDGEVVLICSVCGYRQSHIPRGVLMVNENELDIIKQVMIRDGFNF